MATRKPIEHVFIRNLHPKLRVKSQHLLSTDLFFAVGFERSLSVRTNFYLFQFYIFASIHAT